MQTMEGGCHCGRVRFRVTADLDGVTICNCSICTKKGIWHLIVPPERFELLQRRRTISRPTRSTPASRSTLLQASAASIRSMCRAPIRTRSTSTRAASTTSIRSRITPKYFDGRHWEDAMQQGRAVALKDLAMNARSTAKSATAAISCRCASITRTPTSPASSITPAICASWSAGAPTTCACSAPISAGCSRRPSRRRRALPSWCAR